MGNLHPFRNLYDAAIRHSAVRIVCDHCRHAAIFPTAALWRHFNRNGWSDRFEHVKRRLFCLHCWHRKRVKRRPSLIFCDDSPTDMRFPMPSKRE